MSIPVRHSVLNLVLAALQSDIISPEDLGECTRLINSKDMKPMVHENAIALVESALERGILDVIDLKEASIRSERRIRYSGGGLMSPFENSRGGSAGYGRGGPTGYGRGGPAGYGRRGRGGGGFRGSGPMGGMYGGSSSQADSRPGDWCCPKCGNVNFSWRTVCNISTCKEPKPADGGGGGGGQRYSPYPGNLNGRGRSVRGGQEKRDGDWTCPRCNNMNFAWRSQCNGHGCDQKRDEVEQDQQSQ